MQVFFMLSASAFKQTYIKKILYIRKLGKILLEFLKTKFVGEQGVYSIFNRGK